MSNLEVRAFDRERLLARSFASEARSWKSAESVQWAKDFGAGLEGRLRQADERFLDTGSQLALPMIAVPLCDGDFWQQEADTGIDWRRIVHAEEWLTVHRPLPSSGQAVLTQKILDIRDRGSERGASMVQRLSLSEPDGSVYADVDVTTILRGNGGFGGPAPDAHKPTPIPSRAPDVEIEIRTPSATGTSFCLNAELKVASGISMSPTQRMMRGVGCFGLAGRAALALMCGNDPQRLLRFGVRYAGPMLTDETMRVALWKTDSGQAVFNMRAVERDAPVLNYGSIHYCTES